MLSFLAWYLHVVHTALSEWGKLLSSDYCCRHHDQQYTAAADSPSLHSTVREDGKLRGADGRLLAPRTALMLPVVRQIVRAAPAVRTLQVQHRDRDVIAYKCFVSQRDEMHSKVSCAKIDKWCKNICAVFFLWNLYPAIFLCVRSNETYKESPRGAASGMSRCHFFGWILMSLLSFYQMHLA